jgi:hypothetical protein
METVLIGIRDGNKGTKEGAKVQITMKKTTLNFPGKG